MRVKVDENLPESAARVLRAAGHDADTVHEKGLARFVAQFNLDDLGGCTVIIHPDRVRIRRPD